VSEQKSEILRQINEIAEKSKRRKTPQRRRKPQEKSISIGDIHGGTITINVHYTIHSSPMVALAKPRAKRRPLVGRCGGAASPLVRQVLTALGDELLIRRARNPINRVSKRAPNLIGPDQNGSFSLKAPAAARQAADSPQPRRKPRVPAAPGMVTSLRDQSQSDHLPILPAIGRAASLTAC